MRNEKTFFEHFFKTLTKQAMLANVLRTFPASWVSLSHLSQSHVHHTTYTYTVIKCANHGHSLIRWSKTEKTGQNTCKTNKPWNWETAK